MTQALLPATKVLIVDTETTGLPKKGDQYAFEQPWVIQLGAVLFDLQSDRFEETINTLVVPPEGAIFEPGAVKTHGFSEEVVRANGRPMEEVYSELREMRKKATIVAAYNLDFDERLVRTSSIRAHPDFANDLVLGTPEEVHHHCVMKQAMAVFRKRERLGVVYKRLKGETLEGAHDALADAVAAGVIFKEMLLRAVAAPQSEYGRFFFKNSS